MRGGAGELCARDLPYRSSLGEEERERGGGRRKVKYGKERKERKRGRKEERKGEREIEVQCRGNI